MNSIYLKSEFRKRLSSINDEFARLDALDNINSSDWGPFILMLDELYKNGIIWNSTSLMEEFQKLDVTEKTNQLAIDLDDHAVKEAAVDSIILVSDFGADAISGVENMQMSKREMDISDFKAKGDTELKLIDIKTNIGINDKFQFISELFANNVDAYESAIKKLNADSSLDSSLLVLEEIKKENNWKDKSEAGQRFVEIVKRRFL
ncbi:MAG: hypothetical protein WBM13_09940 [Bacteroidia bacterium]